jgi:succinate-acetate transporter protein
MAAEQELSPEPATRIVLRPMASSLPLGFLAFGTGTILLTSLEAGWLPAAQGTVLMTMVLAFVVPLEALSGLLAFLARDVGAATALALLSAAWAAIALTMLQLPPGGRSPALGIFLLMLSAVMAVLFAAALRGKPLFGIMLAVGACRFALTGVFELAPNTAVEHASGWIGLPLAAFTLYGGLALLLEDSASRTILPLGRRGRASLEGDLRRQIEHAELEAGVRRQL